MQLRVMASLTGVLVAVLIEQVPWLRGQDRPLSSSILHLEAVVLIDKLPHKLRRHDDPFPSGSPPPNATQGAGEQGAQHLFLQVLAKPRTRMQKQRLQNGSPFFSLSLHFHFYGDCAMLASLAAWCEYYRNSSHLISYCIH